MDCKRIHEFFFKKKEAKPAMCPFCMKMLLEVKSVETKCCNRSNIVIDGFEIVCTNCGSVHGFKSTKEFVDFHKNRHRKKEICVPQKISYFECHQKRIGYGLVR